MKKKITALCLCVALLAVAVVGASLAYFTDTKTATNTFTVGNVKIDLLESRYHRVNAGRGVNVAEPEKGTGGYLYSNVSELLGTPENTPNYTTSAETWTGTYFSDAQIEADAKIYKAEGGYYETNATGMAPGDNVLKCPYVKNTGKEDAYVRVRVLIPVSLFDIIDNGPSYWTTTAQNEGQVVSNCMNIYTDKKNFPTTTKGEIEYYVFSFTYTKALKPGELTFWNCWGNIAIDKNATSEQLANVESFDVIVEADAIQADGFADYEAAFKAFDAKA